MTKGAKVDAQISKDAEAAGGEKFADLANLSYRQALGAHKIVADIDGKPMMFSKENFSNGCIGTVDVLYPAAPIMLAYNPEMLEANLRPLFIYASLPRWKWDFALTTSALIRLRMGRSMAAARRPKRTRCR